MSHVVTIEAEIKDPDAVADACQRLGLARPADGEAAFYDGSVHRGLIVRLPGWTYPVVVEPGGTLHYDHFGGRWGDLRELGRFRQAYAVEKVRRVAARGPYRLRETAREDGSVHLTLTL